MKKRKSKAVVMSATGRGGMLQIKDHRFEPGDWPIRFEVPRPQADTWLQYLASECRKKNWACSNFAQLDAKENNGSITVQSDNPEHGPLTIVWERKREGPLGIRARSAQSPGFPAPLAEELIDRVNQQCSAGVKESFYARGLLEYQGLPWRGELWLDDSLRLGPPSKQDERTLLGPRIVLVDTRVDAIDLMEVSAVFALRLRELSVFLSVVTRTRFQVPRRARSWTWTVDPGGQIDCDIREMGYVEVEPSADMPTEGQVSPVPLDAIQRPDFSIRGITGQETQQSIPGDISDLWRTLRELSPELRQQFFQVGSLWHLARSITHDYPTAGFSLMVAAVEALKPPRKEFKAHSMYHVVEALLGKETADLLKQDWFEAQNIRNVHFHRGEFRGSEFAERAMMSSYSDPTFDQAHRALGSIASAAIVEWLLRKGSFSMTPLRQRANWRRRAKKVGLAAIMVATGLLIGWLLWGA